MRRATHSSTWIASSLFAVLHKTNRNSCAPVDTRPTGRPHRRCNIRLDRPDDASCLQFTELLTSFYLLQHVDQPTHGLGGILDVVVTRSDLVHPVVEVVDVGISNHRLIKWTDAGCPMTVSDKLKTSDVTIDAALTFEEYVNHVAQTCNFVIYGLRHIRRSISRDS